MQPVSFLHLYPLHCSKCFDTPPQTLREENSQLVCEAIAQEQWTTWWRVGKYSENKKGELISEILGVIWC